MTHSNVRRKLAVPLRRSDFETFTLLCLALLWQIGLGCLVDVLGTVWAFSWWRAHEVIKNGLPDGRQARLRGRSSDSFFSVPRP